MMGRMPILTVAGMMLALALAGCQNGPQRQTTTQNNVKPQTSTGWDNRPGSTPPSGNGQPANAATYPNNPNSAANNNYKPYTPGAGPASTQPVGFSPNVVNPPTGQNNVRVNPYQGPNPTAPAASNSPTLGGLVAPTAPQLPDNVSPLSFGGAAPSVIQPPINKNVPTAPPMPATAPAASSFGGPAAAPLPSLPPSYTPGLTQ